MFQDASDVSTDTLKHLPKMCEVESKNQDNLVVGTGFGSASFYSKKTLENSKNRKKLNTQWNLVEYWKCDKDVGYEDWNRAATFLYQCIA